MKRCGLGKTGEYSDREPIEYGMKCADEGLCGGGEITSKLDQSTQFNPCGFEVFYDVQTTLRATSDVRTFVPFKSEQ